MYPRCVADQQEWLDSPDRACLRRPRYCVVCGGHDEATDTRCTARCDDACGKPCKSGNLSLPTNNGDLSSSILGTIAFLVTLCSFARSAERNREHWRREWKHGFGPRSSRGAGWLHAAPGVCARDPDRG